MLKKKILIALNHPEMLNAYKDSFDIRNKQLDAQIFYAGTVAECMEILDRERPCLMFLDMDLGDRFPPPAFRIIREYKDKTKIIVMTSYGYTGFKDQVLKEGAEMFVGNSIKIEDMINLIGNHTEGYGVDKNRIVFVSSAISNLIKYKKCINEDARFNSIDVDYVTNAKDLLYNIKDNLPDLFFWDLEFNIVEEKDGLSLLKEYRSLIPETTKIMVYSNFPKRNIEALRLGIETSIAYPMEIDLIIERLLKAVHDMSNTAKIIN